MSRTLITGAAGFTGRYLTALLAARGHEVHGVVHDPQHEPVSSAAEIHVADLTDSAAISKVVQEVTPDHVVHLAGIAFVAHGNVEELYRSNVVGSRHLLGALSLMKRMPMVLFASSANVYGNGRGGVLDETSPLMPANDYGVSKVAAEYVAGLYRARLPIIVARPFNYTGRGQSADFLIPKIIRHVNEKASFVELGNLDVERDFSDVRFVVDLYARLLDTPAAAGGTFNVCSGRAVSLKNVLEMIGDLSGHQMEVRVNPAFVRVDEVKSLAGSRAKLEGTIGHIIDIPLRETLQWMLETSSYR